MFKERKSLSERIMDELKPQFQKTATSMKSGTVGGEELGDNEEMPEDDHHDPLVRFL